MSDYDPANNFQGRKMVKSLNAFAAMEAMPGDLRECVREYGYTIVRALVDVGIRDPRHIHHVVCTVWDGARHPWEHQRNKAEGSLDWLLIQAGSPLSAAAIIRVMQNNSYLVVPQAPSDQMVNASIEAIRSMGRVTKTTKHRVRLREANKVGANHIRRAAHA